MFFFFIFNISDKKWAKNQKYERNIWIQCNFDKNSIRKLQLLENISSKSSKKLIFKGDVIEIKFHNSYKKSILGIFSENPLFEGGVFLDGGVFLVNTPDHTTSNVSPSPKAF